LPGLLVPLGGGGGRWRRRSAQEVTLWPPEEVVSLSSRNKEQLILGFRLPRAEQLQDILVVLKAPAGQRPQDSFMQAEIIF